MDTIAQIAPVVFFDGLCNLCNASVNFILERDKKGIFRFASLQGDFAKKTLPTDYTRQHDLPSLVLLMNGKILVKSTAALTIARHLLGLWPVLYTFIIIPPFIRHAVYNFIARNRYRWFGKKEECTLPTPELKARFFD